jgi:ABC-type xylose transport system permease subunit
MTVTIDSDYFYLGVILILMLIQVLQIRSIRLLRQEVSNLWEQISIIAITTSGLIQKVEKKIDGKQDK